MKTRYMILLAGIFGGVFSVWASYSDSRSLPSASADLSKSAEYIDIPQKYLSAAKSGVASLLRACPRIGRAAQYGEHLVIHWYGQADMKGWEATGAHLDVEIWLSPESLKNLPVGLSDPQWGGHAEMGLTSYPEPGAIMETPLPEWLCNFDVPQSVLDFSERHWDQVKVRKPLPIKIHSF